MNECRIIAVTDTTEVSIEAMNLLVSIQTTKDRISNRYVPTNRTATPWLRPYKQEGNTVVTSIQTGGPYRGCVPTNRRDIPWLRPYKQEGHNVAASLQTGGPYRGSAVQSPACHR
jgi:hypothetical protein